MVSDNSVFLHQLSCGWQVSISGSYIGAASDHTFSLWMKKDLFSKYYIYDPKSIDLPSRCSLEKHGGGRMGPATGGGSATEVKQIPQLQE